MPVSTQSQAVQIHDPEFASPKAKNITAFWIILPGILLIGLLVTLGFYLVRLRKKTDWKTKLAKAKKFEAGALAAQENMKAHDQAVAVDGPQMFQLRLESAQKRRLKPVE